jgi:hypothetical protein
MRALWNLVGIVLILVGIVWILQEYAIIPGGFLINEVHFAHRGIIAACLGLLIMILVAARKD